jgi:hypothetical protein
MRRTLKWMILGVAAIAVLAIIHRPLHVSGQTAKAQTIDFNRQIKPLFEASCYKCHGASRAMGQLRLDVKKLAFDGGISGPTIIPGKGAESRLVHRLLGAGGESKMPLGGDPFTPEQIDLIRLWIDQGAFWPDDSALSTNHSALPSHWAYVKPVHSTLPAVREGAWVRNPIDNFILARLEKEGLKPSAEAEKGKLLRRVYLDLTGLPPSPSEVAAFLADRSADAYEKVVDRLLSSPAYGERWARVWLDLARYADSNGFEKDSPRVMWKYRDWVIDAFNRDLPFNQFTIEQLAGDMLPNPTREQMIATGFHRNTMLNQEGGIDPYEARFDILVDRVNTTSTVWLGSTLGCAQCHNHKYDPFTQKDYYRFYAFFEGAEYEIGYQSPGEDITRYVKEPEISLPTPEQEAKRLKLDAELKRSSEILSTHTPALDQAQSQWEQELRAAAGKWVALDAISARSLSGTTFTQQSDSSILAGGANPEVETYIVSGRTSLRGVTGVRLEALADSHLPKGGPGRDPYGNFLLTGIEAEVAPAGQPGRRTKIEFKDARVDDAAIRFEAARFFRADPQNSAVDAPRGWYVNATRDDVRMPRQAVFNFAKPIGYAAGTLLTIKLKFEGGSLGQGIGRFRLSVTNAADPLAVVVIPARLRTAMALAPPERTQKQRDEISSLYRSVTPLLAEERQRAARLRDELRNLGIVTALITRERPDAKTPSTFIRERGNFMLQGERVEANVPAIFKLLPEGKPVNRLALARWLVDENNPLVARVFVNRLWDQVFGRGIVETSEDFGSQGSMPTHPELLDWLATEFIGGKWSMKSILRVMVNSAAYRQSSAATPALLERDPDNRLLARGPRFRIEAEMVRDVALSASGLLSRKVGGPSVYPPQPEGIWRNPYSGARWVTSEGEDRYRRSIYTFIRRTSPYPSMVTFDATSREYCTVRRVRTNTPLQSLTALNDEAFFEMARAMGARILKEAGAGLRGRLNYGFTLVTSRAPKAEEVDRLERYYQEQFGRFLADPAAAQKVVSNRAGTNGKDAATELATWTMVANVLLNLDETLTKE